MANPWVQGAIVALIVTAAVVYLLRKYLPRKHPAKAQGKGCGSCGGCSGGGCH